MKVPAPQYKSSAQVCWSHLSPSRTSLIRVSAPRVLTWKNDGAESVIVSSPILSVHEPLPQRRSVPTTLRARRLPFERTRTMLVSSGAALLRIFETYARGKAPGLVQSASSTSFVRTLARMPMRSSPRSCDRAMNCSAPATDFVSFAKRASISAQLVTGTSFFSSGSYMPIVSLPCSRVQPSSILLR